MLIHFCWKITTQFSPSAYLFSYHQTGYRGMERVKCSLKIAILWKQNLMRDDSYTTLTPMTVLQNSTVCYDTPTCSVKIFSTVFNYRSVIENA